MRKALEAKVKFSQSDQREAQNQHQLCVQQHGLGETRQPAGKLVERVCTAVIAASKRDRVAEALVHLEAVQVVLLFALWRPAVAPALPTILDDGIQELRYCRPDREARRFAHSIQPLPL